MEQTQVYAIDNQGNRSKGEYTGYSNGKYWVSFYNGYTKGFDSFRDLEFIPHESK